MDPTGLKETVTGTHLEGMPTTWGNPGTAEELQLVYDYLVGALNGKEVPELPQPWIAAWAYY